MFALGLWLSLTLVSQPLEDLQKSLSIYWDQLTANDKAAALQWVTPDTRNAFINRREPRILDWELLEIDAITSGEARVTVRVMREIPGVVGIHPIEIVERWVRPEGSDSWQVSVRRSESGLFASLQAQNRSKTPVREGEIVVLPDTMRIPFINPRRLGVVHIDNGLDASLRLDQVEFDQERFGLVEAPATIAPGQRARLVMEYQGDELAKNLKSRLELSLQGDDGTTRSFEIPIIYNYFSKGARALFGLTRDQADEVGRDDELTPKVSTPATREALKKARELKPPKARPPRAFDGQG